MTHVRFATSNMFKRLDAAQSTEHVEKVTGRADVVVWQEVTRTHKHTLRALVGWDTYFAGSGMAISWRASKFRVHRRGMWRSVVSGIRRIDPARGFADIILEDIRDGTLWPVVCTHMTHQAFTSHPERRPRWRVQAYRLWRRCRRLARKHGRVVGGGDVNRNRWAPRGTIGAWPEGGTLGRAKYDVIWRKGAVRRVGVVERVNTPSDHHTAIGTFEAA
jgi:hypothetical protein